VPDALAAEMDDQQLYGGTQSALSTTLLLWRTSAGADGAPIVEKQRSHPGLLFVSLATVVRAFQVLGDAVRSHVIFV
jgi:hypothetical protein